MGGKILRKGENIRLTLCILSCPFSFLWSTNAKGDVSSKTQMKAYIRGEIIYFLAFKNKCLRQKQIDISNQIFSLHTLYANSPPSDLYKECLKLKSLTFSHLIRLKAIYSGVGVCTTNTMIRLTKFWLLNCVV